MSVVFVASVVITWSASEHARFVRGYEYTTAVGVATATVSLTDPDGYGDGYDAAVTDRPRACSPERWTASGCTCSP